MTRILKGKSFFTDTPGFAGLLSGEPFDAPREQLSTAKLDLNKRRFGPKDDHVLTKGGEQVARAAAASRLAASPRSIRAPIETSEWASPKFWWDCFCAVSSAVSRRVHLRVRYALPTPTRKAMSCRNLWRYRSRAAAAW
jgi:hypothetical protein